MNLSDVFFIILEFVWDIVMIILAILFLYQVAGPVVAGATGIGYLLLKWANYLQHQNYYND